MDAATGATEEEIEAAKKRDQIPGWVRVYNQQRVALTGFMLPLVVENGLARKFIMMRDITTCCFGNVPNMNEYVIVTMKGTGVKPLQDVPVVLTGVFKISEIYEGGLPDLDLSDGWGEIPGTEEMSEPCDAQNRHAYDRAAVPAASSARRQARAMHCWSTTRLLVTLEDEQPEPFLGYPGRRGSDALRRSGQGTAPKGTKAQRTHSTPGNAVRDAGLPFRS